MMALYMGVALVVLAVVWLVIVFITVTLLHVEVLKHHQKLLPKLQVVLFQAADLALYMQL